MYIDIQYTYYILLTKVIMQGKLIAVAYILKPVLSGWNLYTRIDGSVCVYYSRRLKELNFDNFDNSPNSVL